MASIALRVRQLLQSGPGRTNLVLAAEDCVLWEGGGRKTGIRAASNASTSQKEDAEHTEVRKLVCRFCWSANSSGGVDQQRISCQKVSDDFSIAAVVIYLACIRMHVCHPP
jgi:hypothetical protein